MEVHPDFLSQCSPSAETMKDLEFILAASNEIAKLKEQLVQVETSLNEHLSQARVTDARKHYASQQQIAAAAASVGGKRLQPPPMRSQLCTWDCFVCGKDVLPTSFVGHLRECMQRNDEYAHSTVTQNPGLCNFLSRRTNRYCSLPKPCRFSFARLSDWTTRILFVALNDCKVMALHCLKHADWRDVGEKGSRLSLKLLQDKMRENEERIVFGQAAHCNARKWCWKEEKSK